MGLTVSKLNANNIKSINVMANIDFEAIKIESLYGLPTIIPLFEPLFEIEYEDEEGE